MLDLLRDSLNLSVGLVRDALNKSVRPEPVEERMSAISESDKSAVVLIISASGRALAASAARAGLSAVVLDLFGDLDTQVLSAASRACINAKGGWSRSALFDAIDVFRPPSDYAACVVGSGLEGRPAWLRAVVDKTPYRGNSPGTIEASKDPVRFFSILDRLGIAHPDVCFSPPVDLTGWLSKRVGAAGGMHIRMAARGWPRCERRYFQRFQPGKVMSVLFLANAARACLVGFSEQWSCALSPHAQFAYGGAVSVHDLSAETMEQVAHIVSALTHAFRLRGLNGLDFILDGDQPHVIEVNPRPTATMDLHDDRVAGGLLRAHLAAVEGNVDARMDRGKVARAHAILWSERSQRVPHTAHWPDWVSDIPAPGSVISARRPVCTAHAQAETAAMAKRIVMDRLEQLRAHLWPMAA